MQTAKSLKIIKQSTKSDSAIQIYENFRVAMLAFFITILISFVICTLGLSVFRMENTISEKPYVLFSFEKISEKELEIIFANRNILSVDAVDAVDFVDEFTNLLSSISKNKDFIPAKLRFMAYSVNLLFDRVSIWVYNYLSSA